MPIWRLSPVVEHLDDPDWTISSYRGAAWANTSSAQEARRLLSGRFDEAAADQPRRTLPRSPWLQERLVSSVPDVAPNGIDIPEGSIVTERLP